MDKPATTSWTSYFDAIYLINLLERTDRLEISTAELNKYGIPFTIYSAIKRENGAKGLWLTMLEIFKEFTERSYDRILVFEDDIEFVQDPNEHMPHCLSQLKSLSWHLFHLGPNTHEPLQRVRSRANLLKMNRCRSTHAVAYNRAGVEQIIKTVSGTHESLLPEHFDVFLEQDIQPLGMSYCSLPMLATQRADHSDIGGKYADQSYIITRFAENTKHLRQ